MTLQSLEDTSITSNILKTDYLGQSKLTSSLDQTKESSNDDVQRPRFSYNFEKLLETSKLSNKNRQRVNTSVNEGALR